MSDLALAAGEVAGAEGEGWRRGKVGRRDEAEELELRSGKGFAGGRQGVVLKVEVVEARGRRGFGEYLRDLEGRAGSTC